ncbi:toxin-antitoxin system HicB family antitoxin [Crenothrix sp.]|uniref:toxin-antitoxin system HicB family antitoxin n=1 Tax=Crenothrix sp. TaxID=3100433 RepID=UPI00374D79EC
MSEILIKPITPPYPFEAYAHIIEPLSVDEGGGFLITLPDLPGCIADGSTELGAIEAGRDAFLCWVSATADMGDLIPAPRFRTVTTDTTEPSGKFVQRVPKSIHAQLAVRAKQEGVSLNSLVLTFIAEGLGRSDALRQG